MPDTNWKTWALIAAVLVGISIEMIKRMPKDSPAAAWDRDNLTEGHRQEPYNIRLQAAQSKQPTAAKVGANSQSQVTREQLERFLKDNSTTQTQFEHVNKDGETKTAAAVKKKKDDDEWEEVTDPKTGKKVRRKKKKKQAKKEDKKEEVKPVVKEEAPKKTQDHDLDNAIDEAVAYGVMNPAPPVNQNEALNSLEDWIKRLLGRPDLNETKRFIEQYNNRLVSAEVFFKVTDMMLEDSRLEMKRLGVMALSLTPSVMSFQMLAQVVHQERSDSKIRQDAERAILRYADMINMGVIETVLRTPTPSYSTVVAAQTLETAARRYLSLDAARPRPPSQTSTASTSATYFRRYIAILETLSKSTDASVKDQAGRTLNSLQTLLSPSQPS